DDDVDVLRGSLDRVHRRRGVGAVQADAGRADDAHGQAGSGAAGDQCHRLLLDEIPGGHYSIGICLNASSMSTPWLRRYSLLPTYHARPATNVPTMIHSSVRWALSNSAPAALSSVHSSTNAIAKKTVVTAPVTVISGSPANRYACAGEALKNRLPVHGNTIATAIAMPQITSSASISVSSAMPWKAISHMKTIEPAVPIAIATTGVW